MKQEDRASAVRWAVWLWLGCLAGMIIGRIFLR